MRKKWKIWGSVIGLVIFLVALIIASQVQPQDLLEPVANLVQLVSFLGVLLLWLWPSVRTVIGCLGGYFYSFRLGKTWAGLLLKSGADSQKMLSAFLRRYVEEEIRDISGIAGNGKHFVVTNFVAYSSFVDKVVRAARGACPDDQEVVCFTTLTMPLSKWFNFSEVSGQDFPYLAINKGWEDYTNGLRLLVAADSQSKVRPVKVRRCLLAVDDAVALKYERDSSFGFRRESQIKKHINYYILVPEQTRMLKPVDCKIVKELFPNPEEKLQKLLNPYVGHGPDSSYLILPIEEIDCMFVPQGYCWKRLGSAFTTLYHSGPATENARCKILKSEEWENNFGSSAEVRMPEDVFIVGFCPDFASGQSVRWVFCLAGDVESTLDKLSLEFVSEKLNGLRFDAIKNYVTWLNGKSQELQDFIADTI